MSEKFNLLREMTKGCGDYLRESYPLNKPVHVRIEDFMRRLNVVLLKAGDKSNDSKTLNRVNFLYDLFVSSGCKDGKDFASYYIENEIFPKYDKVYRDDIVNELLTPVNFVNKTKYVRVKTLTNGWRLGYLGDRKLSFDDYIRFNLTHSKDNIKDFVEVYVAGLGFNFYRRTDVNNKHVFLLNGGKRYCIIRLLARDDETLVRKYIDVFKRNPIETEYILFAYSLSKDVAGTVQYFNDEIYRFENPVDEKGGE